MFTGAYPEAARIQHCALTQWHILQMQTELGHQTPCSKWYHSGSILKLSHLAEVELGRVWMDSWWYGVILVFLVAITVSEIWVLGLVSSQSVQKPYLVNSDRCFITQPHQSCSSVLPTDESFV